MLERLNEEIKRRTRVAGLFPNESSALRLVSAVLMEISHHAAIPAPEPMKMGSGSALMRVRLLRWAEAVVLTGASSPNISLARTSSRTRTCRPRALGEHEEQLAPSPDVPRCRRPPEETRRWTSCYRCCAGLDVHKKTVVACVRRVSPAGEVEQQVRTFGTMTADLLDLADWLAAPRRGPRRDGIDRRLLEAGLQPPGGPLRGPAGQRPAHQAGPGPQDRRQGRQWIAQLLQHGLLRPSFIPPRPIRELRDLTRQRTQLIRERAVGVQPDPEGAGGRQHQAGRASPPTSWASRAAP